MNQLLWLENYIVNRRQFGGHSSWRVRLEFRTREGKLDAFIRCLETVLKVRFSPPLDVATTSLRQQLSDLITTAEQAVRNESNSWKRPQFVRFSRNVLHVLRGQWVKLNAFDLWVALNACKCHRIFPQACDMGVIGAITAMAVLKNVRAIREFWASLDPDSAVADRWSHVESGSVYRFFGRSSGGVKLYGRSGGTAGYLAIGRQEVSLVAYADTLQDCHSFLKEVLRGFRFRYRPVTYSINAVGSHLDRPTILRDQEPDRMHCCRRNLDSRSKDYACPDGNSFGACDFKSEVSSESVGCAANEKAHIICQSSEFAGRAIGFGGPIPGLRFGKVTKVIMLCCVIGLLVSLLLYFLYRIGWAVPDKKFAQLVIGLAAAAFGTELTRVIRKAVVETDEFFGWLPKAHLKLKRVLE